MYPCSFHHSTKLPQISITKSEMDCTTVDMVSFIFSQTACTKSLKPSLDLYKATNNAIKPAITPITIKTGAEIAPIAPPKTPAAAFTKPNHLLTFITAVINFPITHNTGPIATAIPASDKNAVLAPSLKLVHQLIAFLITSTIVEKTFLNVSPVFLAHSFSPSDSLKY